MHRVLKIMTALALLGITAGAQAADWQEGKHYKLVTPAQPTSVAPDEVEVLEFFFYGCPHCYALEPHIETWLEQKPEKIKFKRVPATLNPAWQLMARAYYTAEALNVLDVIHPALFNEYHTQKNFRIASSKELIQELFKEKAGVNEEDFRKAFESFAVASKVKRADVMAKRYLLTGVPAIIINGKYSADATMAGGYSQLVQLTDSLAKKELEAAQ